MTLEDLALTEDGKQVKQNKNANSVKTTSASVSGDIEVPEVTTEVDEDLSPAQLRSKADKLFKEAQVLRKQADAIDPPKPRTKKVSAEA